MNVIHLIPSAFEYFDDIRNFAFGTVEYLNKLGVDTEIFTLQYGGPTRAIKTEVRTAAPGRKYLGEFSLKEIISRLDNFDLVHLHCPFLGAAGSLLHWKAAHPKKPLLVSFYRRVRTVDLISFYIKLYNSYYLPKIFKAADAVTCFSFDDFQRNFRLSHASVRGKLVELAPAVSSENIHLTQSVNEVKLVSCEEVASALFDLYHLTYLAE